MKKVKLGEVTINIDNRRKPLNNLQRIEKSLTKKYPYCGANNIIDFIDEYIFDENEEILCIAEDGGSWGKDEECTYVMNEKCWVNNHAHVLKMKTGVDINYIKLNLDYLDLTSYITGSTRGKLTKSSLEKIELKLPDYHTQISISKKISDIQKFITKKKDQIQKYNELVKSRFNEMFGDPVLNEMGWEIETLNKIGTIGRGVSKHRPRNASELFGGIYPFIQTGDVANSGNYIVDYHSTYSEFGLKQSKLWDKGTLCITIAANIAKTSILAFDSCFPDSIVGFIPGERTNNMFIHYWFSYFQKILESQAPESAQKNINLKILSELKVILPPLSLQNEFADFVAQVDKSQLAIQKSLEELETLKKSLMQEYFG